MHRGVAAARVAEVEGSGACAAGGEEDVAHVLFLWECSSDLVVLAVSVVIVGGGDDVLLMCF